MYEGLSRRALQSGQPASLSWGRDEPVSGRPPPSAHASPPGVPRLTTTIGTGPGATVCRTPLPGGAQVGAWGSGAGGGGDLLGGVRAGVGGPVLCSSHCRPGGWRSGEWGVGSTRPPTRQGPTLSGVHRAALAIAGATPPPAGQAGPSRAREVPVQGARLGHLLGGPGRSRGSVLPVGVRLSGCWMRSQRPLPRF